MSTKTPITDALTATFEGSSMESESAAIAVVFEQLYGLQQISAERGTSAVAPIVAVPKGLELQSLKPLLDQYLTRPERRRGTATVGDLESFIAFLERYADKDSVIFADPSKTAPTLLAVLNHHPATERHVEAPTELFAGYGDHRAKYACPLSEEWKAWIVANEKPMTQAAFASFIEDRIGDVILAMDDHEALMQLLTLVGGKFASPSNLLALSRGLAVNVSTQVKQAITLASGEITVQYAETHNDGEGAPLSVPNLFAIAIPVFYAGAAYRIAVRLRYRLAEGKITWSYSLYRPDRVFDDAFGGIVTTLREEQDWPVFIGAPES